MQRRETFCKGSRLGKELGRRALWYSKPTLWRKPTVKPLPTWKSRQGQDKGHPNPLGPATQGFPNIWQRKGPQKSNLVLIPGHENASYVENAVWPSLHVHRKPPGGRAFKLCFALSSFSNPYGKRLSNNPKCIQITVTPVKYLPWYFSKTPEGIHETDSRYAWSLCTFSLQDTLKQKYKAKNKNRQESNARTWTLRWLPTCLGPHLWGNWAAALSHLHHR